MIRTRAALIRPRIRIRLQLPFPLLALTLLAALGLSARAAELEVPFEKYTLANGLEVILSPDHRVPIVHVQLWYHVGSKDEQAGKTGFAHLFEHMMFQGSRDLPEDTWFKKLDAVGGFGINGTTNTERTNYFESVPSNQLALALWMEADRMGFLLDRVDDQALANQKDVVRNERRQSYEMRPYGMARKATFEALYPATHPYHHTTIGEHEDLQNASTEDVKRFFRTFYVPSNATLVVAGDFDGANVRALVEKYFATLPAVKAPMRLKAAAPLEPVVKTVAMEANVQLPRFDYVWHGPAPFAAGQADLDLAGMMLSDGKSSRLFKRLVYELKVAQQVSADLEAREYGGQFSIAVTVRPGHTIDEVRRAVDAELARLDVEPFTEAELERAKTKVEAALIRELETPAGKATRLEWANHYTHDPAQATGFLAAYRRASPASVRAAVARWLGRPKLVVTVVPSVAAPLGGRMIAARDGKPASTAAPVSPTAAPVSPTAAPVASVAPAPLALEEPWRKEQPKGGPAPEVKLPAPRRGTLACGLPVLVVESHELPVVEAYLVVYAGGERTRSAEAGLADLTAGLITEGTATHDALALADALDGLGARLTAGASADAAYVSLNTLTRHLDPALDLFAEVITSPAFAESELSRVRDQRLTSLLQQKDQPPMIASNTAGRVVYGDHHPYAFPNLGTEQALKGFTRKDVTGFFDTYYRPNNAELIVVGDTTLASVKSKLDARLGAWKAQPVPPPVAPKAPRAAGARKVFLVDQPQASQSVIALAHAGVARSSPDYVPLVVANYILGGSFSSRINMNLRERHGYSYGARSAFAFLRGPGLFFAGGSVRANVTKEALVELLKEVTDIRDQRVTDEELAETRSSLVGKMPARFETNGAVASMLAELLRNRLPIDWYASYARKVEAVTAADVQRVARKYLLPARAQIVVVGDRQAIEASLRALALGTVELRGRFGEPLPAP